MSHPAQPKHQRATPPRGRYSRHYLPHVDYEGLLQFVTFGLADALSDAAVAEADPTHSDAELDAAHGACLLGQPRIADVVRATLHHFDGERYHLGPWVIMPNHVHVVL